MTARMPARSAASIWLRISASSGDTITVGPAPSARSSAVATKYTADLPHPVRCTTNARLRSATSACTATHWSSRRRAPGPARRASVSSACVRRSCSVVVTGAIVPRAVRQFPRRTLAAVTETRGVTTATLGVVSGSPPAGQDGRVTLPQSPLFGSVADVGAAPGRRRLPGVDGRGHHRLPRRPTGQAAAGRGPGRGRQDRAGQGRGRGDGVGPGAAAVLRGHRRGARTLRVEPRQAAAAHHGGPGQGELGRDARRRLQRGVPPAAPAPHRDPAHRADRAADRRDGQGRRRGRGPAAGGALGLPGDGAGDGHRQRGAAPVRAADLQLHARAVARRSSVAACSSTSTSPTPIWNGAS